MNAVRHLDVDLARVFFEEWNLHRKSLGGRDGKEEEGSEDSREEAFDAEA
jgi:hypothetical protein